MQKREIISELKTQVKFMVVGKIKHYVDFSCVKDSKILYIESKGKDLALGKLKRLIVEEKHCLKIYVVYKVSEIDAILK